MSDKHTFIDSNIILYLFTGDQSKKNLVNTLLTNEYTISTQVVNENVNVCLKKLKFDKNEAFAHGKNLMTTFRMVSIYQDTIANAYSISIKYKLNFWDSLIISSALENECHTLLTEDMHDGLVIEGRLQVTNPFKKL